MQRLLVEPVSPDLVKVAVAFAELQEDRLKADYDLGTTVSRLDALEALITAEDVLDRWPALQSAPNTRTFLLALLFHDRWTRRT